jgi:hypothetical protein
MNLDLPPDLSEHYGDLAVQTGKSVYELIVSDLEEYHEMKRYQENYKEKVRP